MCSASLNSKKRCERLATNSVHGLVASCQFIVFLGHMHNRAAEGYPCYVANVTLIDLTCYPSVRRASNQNEERENGKEKTTYDENGYETPVVEGRQQGTQNTFEGKNASSEDRAGDEAICGSCEATGNEIRTAFGPSKITAKRSKKTAPQGKGGAVWKVQCAAPRGLTDGTRDPNRGRQEQQ